MDGDQLINSFIYGLSIAFVVIGAQFLIFGSSQALGDMFGTQGFLVSGLVLTLLGALPVGYALNSKVLINTTVVGHTEDPITDFRGLRPPIEKVSRKKAPQAMDYANIIVSILEEQDEVTHEDVENRVNPDQYDEQLTHNALYALIELGLVEEAGKKSRGRGKKPLITYKAVEGSK